ncbi:MAG: hypothetical protein WHT09_00755 [Thermogutta sp.]
MPKFWLQIAPLVTLCSLIGLAIYRYQNVNDRIWQMVQAQKRSVKEGIASREPTSDPLGYQTETTNTGSDTAPAASLRTPSTMTSRETITGSDNGDAPISPTGWTSLEITPSVAESHDDSGGEPASNGCSSHTGPNGEAVRSPQITTAVPPRMAITVPPSVTEMSHAKKNASPAAAEPVPADPVVGTQPSAGESSTTAGDSEVASPEVPKPQTGQEPMATADAGGDMPPLVPIAGFRSRSNEGSPRSAKEEFQTLDTQPSVARKMEQSPVVGAGLPLVTIVKSPWFPSEKPQRLPPVDQALPSPQAVSPSEWFPSVPLYPSTGR